MRLDSDNVAQPDLILRIGENHGGKSFISGDDYLEGAPELIVEVASSSASYELHEKFKVYRRNGVHEYLVLRVHDRQIDWFCLQEGSYVRMEPDNQSRIESRVFPGLSLNVSAILSGDLVKMIDDLRKELARALTLRLFRIWHPGLVINTFRHLFSSHHINLFILKY